MKHGKKEQQTSVFFEQANELMHLISADYGMVVNSDYFFNGLI